MARQRDERKRKQILETSKTLFSHSGFYNTSISQIVKAVDMPVGTIYTYFRSKEDIIKTIVEEGWQELYSQLEEISRSGRADREKLKVLIENIIPSLLQDLDFINILLTEAVVFTRIEEKIEKITDLVFSIIKNISSQSNLSRKYMKTALIVIFLGILSSASLVKTNTTEITIEDIITFVKEITESSLGIKL
ncbi:MAG: hypothetical protein DRP87_11855 [Spirochaetes bacterium]|nr:MAG: hypothetical protein DRP87_11855 [Spirochaetota bacterium]